MSDPYDAELRAIARDVARERRVALEEGVYAGAAGAEYETPAEVRMLERLGADAVGHVDRGRGDRGARARHALPGDQHHHQPGRRHQPDKLSHAEVMETADRVKGNWCR